MFQSYNLVEALTAIDSVKLPALFDKHHIDDKVVASVSAQVGPDGLRKRYPEELSGSRRQRVAVTHISVSNRDVILTGEPTGALDSGSRRGVVNNLTTLPRNDSTVVLVARDPVIAAEVPRVVFLCYDIVVSEEGGLSPVGIAKRLTGLEVR